MSIEEMKRREKISLIDLPVEGDRVVADAAAAAAAGKYEAVAAAAKKSAGDNGEYLDGRETREKNFVRKILHDKVNSIGSITGKEGWRTQSRLTDILIVRVFLYAEKFR